MKLHEQIVQGVGVCVRKLVMADQCQFGFQEGKSTTDAIYIMMPVHEYVRNLKLSNVLFFKKKFC